MTSCVMATIGMTTDTQQWHGYDVTWSRRFSRPLKNHLTNVQEVIRTRQHMQQQTI